MSSEKFDSTLDYGDVANLTGKKRQYIDAQIVDSTGEFNYLENPNEYKKARKR
jgi:hypothetical protein